MPDGMLYNNNTIVFNKIEEIDGILKIRGVFERSDSDVWKFIAYQLNNYKTYETIEITVVRDDKKTVYRGKFDGGTIEQRKNDVRINIDFLIED
ncbi:MAG: hypothetical protein MUO82_02790 [Candidatus Thermoplasmatota archaeon]|nr:hypothetical protein [Candidatus Thermoplasmatota archaeon]